MFLLAFLQVIHRILQLCVCAFVCVFVEREREREKGRERERVRESECVCVRERERGVYVGVSGKEESDVAHLIVLAQVLNEGRNSASASKLVKVAMLRHKELQQRERKRAVARRARHERVCEKRSKKNEKKKVNTQASQLHNLASYSSMSEGLIVVCLKAS